MRNHELDLPIAPQQAALVLNGARDCLDIEHFSSYQQVFVTDGAWDDFSISEIGKSMQTGWQLQQDSLSEKAPFRRLLTVLGDGDSIKQRPSHFIETSDQNQTDFEKALHYAIDAGITQADVYWGSGGEMDHFLGNLSVAYAFSELIQLRFFDAKQCYWLLSSEQPQRQTIKGALNKTISLYPFPEAWVSSQGLAYPMKNLHLNQHEQQSLRNKAEEDCLVLTYNGNCWIFIEL